MKTIFASLVAALALASPAVAQSWYSPYSSYMTPSQYGEALGNDYSRAMAEADHRRDFQRMLDMQSQIDALRRQQQSSSSTAPPYNHAEARAILDILEHKASKP